jgi:glycosyltransferase involved in cell wall biosynthesis
MILIFETHPIQYKAPVYQRLQQLRPDSFRVIYGTDSSMRDGYDPEFDRKVTWDTPLLSGYPHTVLQNQKGPALEGFRSLSGRGVFNLLRQAKPKAVLVAPFLFEYDLCVFLSCLLLRIPIWTRTETQDEAFVRARWKADVRRVVYWLAYKFVSHAFYIGALNREHLLAHGMAPEKMSFAPYASPLEIPHDPATRDRLRDQVRRRFDIAPDDVVLLFSGKLIDKKNPGLLLTSLGQLPADLARRVKIIFVGSGPLEPALREEAKKFPGQVHFAGFVNQTEMPSYYLAADILVLPSRRAGETWGLVVSEALQAGCGVIMTNSVGSSRDFGHTERVRVIPDNLSNACTQAIIGLAKLPRSFDWSASLIAPYTVEAAAQAIARQIDQISSPQTAT